MLPRWRDQIRIFLHPRQAILLRVSRGLKPRVTKQQVLPCAEFSGSSTWEAPVVSLKTALRDTHWHGANTRVVLSNHFVRYALVPWSAQLVDSQERMAYLRHCFGATYGEAAKRWDLRMNAPSPDAPSLASGIELTLLESLRATLADSGNTLEAIHPHLMVGANQSRRWMRRGPVWFALVESGHLCLSLLEHGVWKVVRSNLAEADWLPQLEILLAREAMLFGDTQQDWPVVLYWPESDATPKLPGRKVTRVGGQRLDGMGIGSDTACRLAMWA